MELKDIKVGMAIEIVRACEDECLCAGDILEVVEVDEKGSHVVAKATFEFLVYAEDVKLANPLKCEGLNDMKYCLLTFNEEQPATTILNEMFVGDGLEACYDYLGHFAKLSSIDDYYQMLDSDFNIIEEGYVKDFSK